MKKVAIIETGYGWEKIIEKLLKKGFAVDFYTGNENISKPEGVNQLFLITEKYKPKDVSTYKKYSNAIKELIKDKNYDYVISPGHIIELGTNIFHGHSIVHRQNILGNYIKRLFFYFGHKNRIDYFKKLYKPEHQKMFAVSNTIKQDYSKNCGIPEEKITVIPAGHKIDTNIQPIKKAFNANVDTFTFGSSTVGFNNKGGYILLKAMQHLCKKYPNVKCKMIYPGYRHNHWVQFLVKIYNLKNNIEFLDYQNGMSDFYNSIHCLVMPSLHEAFGVVASEAMMHKRPVIISSWAGATDIINDGENGFIFEMNNNRSKNLADKMEYVMHNYNNLDECIDKAFETAKELTWDNFAQKIVDNL